MKKIERLDSYNNNNQHSYLELSTLSTIDVHESRASLDPIFAPSKVGRSSSTRTMGNENQIIVKKNCSNKIFMMTCETGLDFMDNSGSRVDYEDALINAGFGKFHFLLLTVCGMIYMNTAIGITIISFVLPSATCDFQMSSSDKGLLTAAPMLG